MYQLAVPLHRIEDPDLPPGSPLITTPRVPWGWRWTQRSGHLREGPHAPDEFARKLMVIEVHEPDWKVEAWAQTDIGSRMIKWSRQLPNGAARMLARAKTDGKSAMDEYRAMSREQHRTWVAQEEGKEVLRRTGRAILPFVVGLSAYQIARMTGLSLEGVEFIIGATTAGVTNIEDDWTTGTDNDDIDGRSPNSVDPGGGAWNVFSGSSTSIADAMLLVAASDRVDNTGGSASFFSGCTYSTGSEDDDQFAESAGGGRNTGRIGVQLQKDGGGTVTGYNMRGNAGRIHQIDGVSAWSETNIGTSGAANSGNIRIRLEKVGTDLYGYQEENSDETDYLPSSTAVDQTVDVSSFNYTGGLPGFTSAGTGTGTYWAKVRGGSLAVAGGQPYWHRTRGIPAMRTGNHFAGRTW